MFKVLGCDGKQYGPATVEEMTQWIREGRANHATMLLKDGDDAWRPLGQFSELVDVAGPQPPPAPPLAATSANRAAALAAVSAPGWAMMVSGAFGILCSAYGTSVIFRQGPANNEMFKWLQSHKPEASAEAFQTGLILGLVVAVMVNAFIIFAGTRLRRLEARRWVIVAAVLMLLPGCSGTFPSCLLSMPFGLWALMVANKADVKPCFG